MKFLTLLVPIIFVAASCVPAKKYNELLEKEQQCADELAKFKTNALNYEAQAKDYKSKYDLLSEDVVKLKADTSRIGNEYRVLRAKYDKLALINEALETNYDKLRLSGARETATLSAELEAKQKELQSKEDQLLSLAKELDAREQKLEEQEKRLAELNKIIQQQQEATSILKNRVASALKNFENKGLTVIEKDGKIYVSLEAKLLFKSGSTDVEAEGKSALIELAKVLETEKDLEIIVEGHTDTDKMSGSSHPKNNWELSVLRSTSVISIMTSNSNMNPYQIMAAGRSEYHPVDENDKAKNRRIEIIISPDLDALYELIKD
jgi:chemotaxis protein MotB